MNEHQVLISVVIPVFNSERYLHECLDSLRNQTLREIEIICVNDGSTDGSLGVLEHYARADRRFIVIDNERNSGLSIARNSGIAAASGEYILFVDPDDAVDTDLCRKTYECARRNNADLIVYDYASFWTMKDLEKNRCKTSDLQGIGPSDRSALLRMKAFPWLTMYCSEWGRSIGLKFPLGLAYEDTLFHWKIVLFARKIAVMPERIYFYRQRRDSITHRTDWDLSEIVFVYDMLRDFLRLNNLYEEHRDVFLQMQLEAFTWAYDHTHLTHKDRITRLVLDHLDNEHRAYLEQRKPLSRNARDYLDTVRGSLPAKLRRSLRFFAHACYRTTARLVHYAQR